MKDSTEFFVMYFSEVKEVKKVTINHIIGSSEMIKEIDRCKESGVKFSVYVGECLIDWS